MVHIWLLDGNKYEANNIQRQSSNGPTKLAPHGEEACEAKQAFARGNADVEPARDAVAWVIASPPPPLPSQRNGQSPNDHDKPQLLLRRAQRHRARGLLALPASSGLHWTTPTRLPTWDRYPYCHAKWVFFW